MVGWWWAFTVLLAALAKVFGEAGQDVATLLLVSSRTHAQGFCEIESATAFWKRPTLV
jgi:hypothetical protein